MFIEQHEERHKLVIKKMWDRSSLTYWMQWLYPLICVILAAIDPINLGSYLLTAVGGNTALKGIRTLSRNSFHKQNPDARYKPIKYKNGGKDGAVEVDVTTPNLKSNPATGKNEETEENDREGD